MRIGVLALQGDVREHRRALEAAGADVVRVRRPGELDGLDGIVLPGGESTAMGRLLVTSGLLAPLQAAVAAGLPAFGSCAGMILLAREVLDGKPGQPLVGGLDVAVRRNAFGRQVDSFEDDVELAGVPDGPVHAVFIRAPAVESVGTGVEVLGSCAGRVVAVRQGHLLATAFHPELTGDGRVHRLFMDMAAAGADRAAGAASQAGRSVR